MPDCIFCKIIAGEIPSQRVYEDDNVYAFRDITPQAPVHILIIPKEHIASAADLSAENSHLAARCLEAAAKIAKSEGISAGFRIITNSGADGGQTVFHLHFHLLGGKPFGAGLVK
ncbi:MAG: histidine triad nucleotide-binding protein [Oscillospiraceae bacterium]|jgi:histidine triad (HIT) family protein|nr:histidine triad nucleotide-binding protein [Oscillospiraceae bacterium]